MSTGEVDTSEVLSVLQAKGDHFAKLSVVEKKRLNDLEDAIEHIITETQKYRDKAKKSAIEVMNLHILTPNPAFQRADGVSVGKDAAQVTRKVLNILEVKENKLKQTRSEVEIANAKLRSEIDHMRRLRIQTDLSHAKFDHQMAITKEKIEVILGSATETIEQREALLELKDSLERTNAEEQKKFEEEYEEMGKYIKEQNTALEDALLKDRKEEGKEKDSKEAAEGGQAGLISSEDEDEMAGRVGVLTRFAESEQDSLKTIQQTIAHYESLFEQLRSMTGTESLKDVISTYSSIEDEMFSLYNYCQALSSEIEMVETNTVLVKNEMEKYKTQQEEQDAERGAMKKELENKLKASEDLIVQMNLGNSKNSEQIDQIAKKVQNLFFKLQCEQEGEKRTQNAKGSKGPTMSQPGSNMILLQSNTGAGATESNVLDYMAIIERRAVDIISEYLRFKSFFDSALPRSPTPGPLTTMNTFIKERVKDTSVSIDQKVNEMVAEKEDDQTGISFDEHDDKIVKLSDFKEKLIKKIADSQATIVQPNMRRK